MIFEAIDQIRTMLVGQRDQPRIQIPAGLDLVGELDVQHDRVRIKDANRSVDAFGGINADGQQRFRHRFLLCNRVVHSRRPQVSAFSRSALLSPAAGRGERVARIAKP